MLSKFEVHQIFLFLPKHGFTHVFALEILHLSIYIKETYFASHSLLINDRDLGPAVRFTDLVA